MKHFLLIAFFFLSCNSLSATPVILLDENQENILLETNFLEFFADTNRHYSIAEVSSPKFNSRYYRSQDRIHLTKNSQTAYWVRFKLKYPQNASKRWLLEVLELHFNHIEVYIQTKSGLRLLGKSGYQLPFKQRDYLHKNFIFDIPDVASGEEFTIYIQVQTDGFRSFLFKLRSHNYFLYYALNEYYILGCYYGILLIMAIYNMMLYFYIREKLYLYYVLYVGSCILVSFAEDGLGFQFLWNGYPIINTWIDSFIHFVFLFFFTLYSQTFLEFDKYLNRLNYLIKSIFIVYALYFSLSLVFPIYDSTMYVYLLLIPFSLIYVGAIRVYMKGNKAFTRFFLAGYSVTMLGLLILLFRKIGWLTSGSILFVYSLNIGLMVEVVFFSLALAYRLRVIKIEKEKAQESLIQQLQANEGIITQKVIDRTQEIARKTQEIESKNLQLEAQAETLKIQTDEINRMNQLLNQENQALQTNVKGLTKARVLMQEVDFGEFSAIFPTEDDCYRYLAELKWKDNYKCIKCGHDKYTEGQGHSARRCTKCGYNESCTVNTIFYRNHIPIKKAFYLLFLVYANQAKITSVELSHILDLRENTCGKFGKKIKDKMKILSNSTKPRNQDGWSELILD